jgi:hypothetical protein
MDGVGLSHPCDLDSLTRSNGSGNPCRNDGVNLLSTANSNSVLKKSDRGRFFLKISPSPSFSKRGDLRFGNWLIKPGYQEVTV